MITNSKHQSSPHHACPEHVDHIEYVLCTPSLDLLVQKQCCIHRPLCINCPPTYIVLELKHHIPTRARQRVCVECMPPQVVFRHPHFLNLLCSLPHLANLTLWMWGGRLRWNVSYMRCSQIVDMLCVDTLNCG